MTSIGILLLFVWIGLIYLIVDLCATAAIIGVFALYHRVKNKIQNARTDRTCSDTTT